MANPPNSSSDRNSQSGTGMPVNLTISAAATAHTSGSLTARDGLGSPAAMAGPRTNSMMALTVK
ncbi:MAG: hypothetical protein A3B62_04775 [Rhodospirillales bacterium RIFCSPLOWO2_01_FULL_65_14]|nr:MAG: hypothetical protein A3B62_04775 [Rhodospirillales bacterium RIFCSPLOWO2_01_FULL_65_14]